MIFFLAGKIYQQWIFSRIMKTFLPAISTQKVFHLVFQDEIRLRGIFLKCLHSHPTGCRVNGFMDCWIIGFEFKKNHRYWILRKISE
jgi:hypothetical protein